MYDDELSKLEKKLCCCGRNATLCVRISTFTSKLVAQQGFLKGVMMPIKVLNIYCGTKMYVIFRISIDFSAVNFVFKKSM